MGRRDRSVRSWLAHLNGYQLMLAFIAAALTLGTAAVAGFTGFERKWGILAANFGFARQVSVTQDLRDLRTETKSESGKILAEVQRVQLWQLYDQIKRTQRNIDYLKEKKTLTTIEREQLQDFSTQLAEATKDYQTLVAKVKGRP